MPVSAQGGFGTPIVAVTDGTPGALLFGEVDDGVATKVADLGDQPRMIRFRGDVGFVTNFGSDSLTILHWPTKTQAPTVVDTVTVGDGPVSMSILADESGTLWVLTTGYNDNTYTITKVDTSGSLISNTTTTLTDCQNPGHAAFISLDQIAVTSHTDNTVKVLSIAD